MARTLSKSGEQTIQPFTLPERYATPTAPPNAIPIEELVNAGDIVLRGSGAGIATQIGTAYPVYFQWATAYQTQGPAPMDLRYDPNGAPIREPAVADWLGNPEAGEGGVFQFLTQSNIILRACEPINERADHPGILTCVTTRQSKKSDDSGVFRRYYVLGDDGE